MAKNKQVNVRLADDMAADVTDYADTHDMSDAEALRRFADRGRVEFGYAGGDSPTVIEEVAGQLFQIGFILGLAFLLLSFIAPLPFLFLAAVGAISVAGVANVVVWIEPRLTDNMNRQTEAEAEPAPE